MRANRGAQTRNRGRTALSSPASRAAWQIEGFDDRESLIDLLHLAALIAVLLEGRQLLDVVGLVVVLDGEAELDHAVDAAGEGGGLVEGEARREEGGLEEQVDEVLDGLVTLVGGGLGLELL